MQPLLRGLVARRAGLRGREAIELAQQPRRLGEQTGDVVPDGALDRRRLDGAAGAGRCAGAENAILAVALVVLPLRQARRGRTSDAAHGEAAGLAGEQAAQQIAMLRVVAERERGVAR